MKNKIINKGLVIGTIILLISSTPLIIATKVNENTQPSTIYDFGDNSLGTIRITHVPLYYKFFEHRGIETVEYIPPPNNPGYYYYFCEVDGQVKMNFSLTVEHRLNNVSRFFFDRYTWINDLWISEPGTDYFRIEDLHQCVSEAWETYYVNLTEIDQIVPLLTNGENKTLTLYIFGMPTFTNSDNMNSIIELIMPKLKKNFLDSVGGKIPITIVPVQC